MAPPAALPFPAGVALVADCDLDILADGRRLLGGLPTRLLRLGPRAAATAQRFFDGEPVSGDPAERALARRLVSAGLVHPDHTRSTPWDGALVTVVVPVRDRPAPLTRLLKAVGGVSCLVVDDGSLDAAAIEGVARAGGARYLGLPTSVGPAGARNAGLAAVDTPFVAFVDSDCVPSRGWLEPLLAHFEDPAVAAVAPRVVALDGRGWLARYEATRSPLDMGDRPGLVRPRARVPYVPTAALVVRRAVFSNPCFDESLRGGEDVDFVWRAVAAGWNVRFEPTSTVTHHADRNWLEWATRRAFYGSTAGPLARRHPGDIAAVRLPGWLALAGSLLLVRRPVAAAGCVLGAGALLARRLRGVVDDPTGVATLLVARALTRGTAPIVTSAVRAWSPALVAALWSRRLRRAGLVAFAAAAFADWRLRRPRLDPARYLAAHAADDLSYGLGLWWGCWRSRTLRPLLAQVTIGWHRAPPGRRRTDRVQAGPPSSSR
jgi:mycofactocin glycosyltransferase